MIPNGRYDPAPQRLAEVASRANLFTVLEEGAASPHSEIAGAPALLDVRPRVAIIGSRRASAASLRLVESLAVDLVGAGACIVSGAARGTDMAAHLAALAAGGATIACPPFGLGFATCGMGRPELLAAATSRLAMISPFPSRQRPTRSSPIVRNRIVAALADAVVAGEASPLSGTMHCIGMAFELGRPVFFMQDKESADPALRALHRQFIARGATPFRCGEVSAPNLAADVLRAARESIRRRALAADAQLRLIADP